MFEFFESTILLQDPIANIQVKILKRIKEIKDAITFELKNCFVRPFETCHNSELFGLETERGGGGERGDEAKG